MKTLANFQDAKTYLERFHDHARTKYSLDNMLALMEYLNHPEDQFKAVHVAGTSGKTSTSYYLSALLTAAGKKTGLTVSPHITELNERVQINGRPLREKDFCQALTEFLELIEKGPVQPSWFEVIVAFAYWYFAKAGVEYAVVEVGLGGLKDGTNVIRCDDKVCVITDIGLDHLNVLGSRIEEIAAQKIGIVQKGNMAFTYNKTPSIMAVFNNWIDSHGAEIKVIKETEAAAYNDFEAALPDFQRRNWFLAHKAYDYIANRDKLQHLTSQVLRETQAINVPGRMDLKLLYGKRVIMDGAHNAQKMAAFVDSFKRLYPEARPAVVLALKKGKEDQAVAPILGPITGRLITTTFETVQDLPFVSMDPTELANAFDPYVKHVTVVPNQAEAIKQALAGPEDTVIITGSFYLLSQIRNNRLLE